MEILLTVHNIKEWKAELDKRMKSKFDVDNYSECNSDKQWLEDYFGYDPKEAIADEIECWDNEDSE